MRNRDSLIKSMSHDYLPILDINVRHCFDFMGRENRSSMVIFPLVFFCKHVTGRVAGLEYDIRAHFEFGFHTQEECLMSVT